MTAKSTKAGCRIKPAKPYEGFPLFAHATGRWAKKIRGKFHYFGKWDDAAAALEKFNREWPYLQDGRTPPPINTENGCTVRFLCNSFLTSKRRKIDAGELQLRSFADYFEACELLIKHFGKERLVDDLRPDDFAKLRASMAMRWGPIRLKNSVTRIKMVLKFALDEGLIEKPVLFGQSFTPPSAKTLRRVRNEAGLRMFEAEEIRLLLEGADVVMRAMILLAVSGGLGNTDIATLPESAVDFKNGWLDYPRPKTEIKRRIPLWPETDDALKAAIEKRPEAKDQANDGLCFLTRTGKRWVRVQKKREDENSTVVADPLCQKFKKLMAKLDINGRRGFYALRHTFETIGGESRDQVAVNAIMGHVDNSMAAVYRERISDERLKAVTDHVREWLFGYAYVLGYTEAAVEFAKKIADGLWEQIGNDEIWRSRKNPFWEKLLQTEYIDELTGRDALNRAAQGESEATSWLESTSRLLA